MFLKVLSWNIWYHGNLNKVNDFLEKSDADIIGLQEVISINNEIQLSKNLKEKLGYTYIYASAFKRRIDGRLVDIGNAVLSKYPILESKFHNLSKTENRIAIEVNFKAADKVIHVFNTHLFHTHQKPSKLQEEQTENLIKALPLKNTILMGDFNALPQSAAIKKINARFKNTDQDLLPTWSVYPKGCEICLPYGLNYKLDNIFISRNLKSDSYQVQNSKASDHLPISAIIRD